MEAGAICHENMVHWFLFNQSKGTADFIEMTEHHFFHRLKCTWQTKTHTDTHTNTHEATGTSLLMRMQQQKLLHPNIFWVIFLSCFFSLSLVIVVDKWKWKKTIKSGKKNKHLKKWTNNTKMFVGNVSFRQQFGIVSQHLTLFSRFLIILSFSFVFSSFPKHLSARGQYMIRWRRNIHQKLLNSFDCVQR